MAEYNDYWLKCQKHKVVHSNIFKCALCRMDKEFNTQKFWFHATPTSNVIGKRLNIAGNACTVISIVGDGLTVKVFYEKWGIYAELLTSKAISFPPLISRDSFNYKPGDRE